MNRYINEAQFDLKVSGKGQGHHYVSDLTLHFTMC